MIDLSEEQWDAVEDGVLVGPDGREFGRRTTREKRRAVDDLIQAGAPLVIYWPGGLPERTRVLWHEGGDEAAIAWSEVRGKLVSDNPDTAKGTVATAGRWQTFEDEVLVLIIWHH